MIKEIILLKGNSNVGRGPRIRKIFERIEAKYNTSNFIRDEGEKPEILKSFKIENKILGITSRSSGVYIDENLKFFKEDKCEICILKCLTNQSSDLEKIYEWVGKNSANILLIENNRDNEEEVIKMCMEKLKNIL